MTDLCPFIRQNASAQDRAPVGYILAVGPALTIVAGVLCVLSLHRALANSPLPVVGFEVCVRVCVCERERERERVRERERERE